MIEQGVSIDTQRILEIADRYKDDRNAIMNAPFISDDMLYLIRRIADWENEKLRDLFAMAKLEAEIEQLQKAQQWMPVSEGLPKIDEPVLVRHKFSHEEYGDVTIGRWFQPTDKRRKPYWKFIAYCCDGAIYNDYTDFICPGNEFVTHWMPLPETPQEKKPLRIYIAAPYSAPTEAERLANTNRAIDAGLAVYRKGHIPFIPHLCHWADARATETGQPLNWHDWMAIDDAWLTECDAILYLAPSRGADIELARAKEMGLRIFYGVDEI